MPFYDCTFHLNMFSYYPGNECSILDFTSQGIKKIDVIPNASPVSVIYDKNAISHIENLQQYEDLQQVSSNSHAQRQGHTMFKVHIRVLY